MSERRTHNERPCKGKHCAECTPNDSGVSAWDLLGIAPDWTDGMSSVDWVRAQRDRN